MMYITGLMFFVYYISDSGIFFFFFGGGGRGGIVLFIRRIRSYVYNTLRIFFMDKACDQILKEYLQFRKNKERLKSELILKSVQKFYLKTLVVTLWKGF